jgi:hypothetical protein
VPASDIGARCRCICRMIILGFGRRQCWMNWRPSSTEWRYAADNYAIRLRRSRQS